MDAYISLSTNNPQCAKKKGFCNQYENVHRAMKITWFWLIFYAIDDLMVETEVL